MVLSLLKKLIGVSGYLAALFYTLLPVSAFAIIAEDRHAVIYDTTYYQDCVQGNQDAGETGGVVLIGDSIMEGIRQSVQTEFSESGWQPTVDALQSRQLTGGPTPDGLTAIDNNKAIISTAKAVVIELGANPSNGFAENVAIARDRINIINPNAAVYWVDIASNSPDKAAVYSAENQALSDLSASKNFKIIPWFKMVFPNGDPNNISPGLVDPNNLISTNDGLNVHPTAAGVSALSNLIVDTVALGTATGSNGAGTIDATSCCQEPGNGGNGTLPSSVPEPYNGIFTQAGQRHNVAPALVAAIFFAGEHANSWPDPPPPYGTGPQWAQSSAGATGPFQFLPSTWNSYKDDGNGDGNADIMDLADAAFGAAKYLGANGGTIGSVDGTPGAQPGEGPSIRNAIWHYNHANWYVERVFTAYQQFSNGAVPGSAAPVATGPGQNCGGALGVSPDGFVFPVKTSKATILNNKPQYWCPTSQDACHHDYAAADIAAPTGTVVVAARGGTIISASQDRGKYGATIRIKGADGLWYYYAHMATGSLRVSDNQPISPGTELGVIGDSGDAEGTSPHLHFDISPVENGFHRPGPQASVLLNPQPALVPAFNALPDQ